MMYTSREGVVICIVKCIKCGMNLSMLVSVTYLHKI
jgi:hypothetical protein